MKKILLAIFFLFCSGSVTLAQNRFLTKINNEFLHANAQDQEGNYLAVSFNTNSNMFAIQTFNPSGNHILKKEYVIPDIDKISQIKELRIRPDGKYIITGNVIKNVTELFSAFIIIDPANSTQNIYRINQVTTDTQPLIMDSHSRYIVGTDKKMANGDYHMRLIKFDVNTNILVDSVYYINGSQMAGCGTVGNDGSYLVAGFGGGSLGGLVYILKTDSLGNKKWLNTYVDTINGLGIQPQSIIQVPDGRIFVSGNNGSIVLASTLVCLDKNGNFLWRKVYIGEKFTHMLPVNDNNLVNAGASDRQLVIRKFDLNGNVIWTTNVGKDYDTKRLTDVEVAKDGGVIMTLIGSGKPAPLWWSNIIKLDECGCFIYGCNVNCLSSGIKKNELKDISVYPNPAGNELFTIHGENIISYKLTNMLGSTIKSGVFNGVSIPLTDIEAGLYMIHLSDKEGNVISRKIVRE